MIVAPLKIDGVFMGDSLFIVESGHANHSTVLTHLLILQCRKAALD
jgi:hypothetical protein